MGKRKKKEKNKINRVRKWCHLLNRFHCLTSISFGFLVTYFCPHKNKYTTTANDPITLKIVITQCLLFQIIFSQFP